MHRKSLEAAETLKNSDEGSDKEESKTEESDGSVISTVSKAPSASPKGSSNNLNNNNSNTNNNSSIASGSPTAMAQQQTGNNNLSMAGSHHSPPPPHHLVHHPGGSPMESARQDYNSSTSPSNSNRSYPSLHDTDSEVFRWVDYNQHSIR